jgi:hypothetical protein
MPEIATQPAIPEVFSIGARNGCVKRRTDECVAEKDSFEHGNAATLSGQPDSKALFEPFQLGLTYS